MLFSSTVERLMVTASLWGGWCAAHSLLTKEWVINRTRLQGSPLARFHRLAYVCFSGVTFAAIYLLTPTQGEVTLWAWKGPWRVLQLIFWGAALTLGYLSLRSLDIWRFLGFRSLLPGSPGEQPADRVITYGIYGVMRHPQFAAGLLFLWTRDITDTGLVINLVLSCYLIVGAKLEEKKLEATFGDHYREYRRNTPAFIPRKLPTVRSLFLPPHR